MTALPNSFISIRNPQTQFLSGSSLKSLEQCFVNVSPIHLSLSPTSLRKAKPLTYRRPVGHLQFEQGANRAKAVYSALVSRYRKRYDHILISKALAGADRKDLMTKLPKFIYDKEKALEKTRKILTEKIAQLNSAIDNASALRADDVPNGAAVNSDEIEASI